MSAIILRSASRLLKPLLLAFSVFVLLRGHNEPGGGFVGGLLAAAAFALQAISAGPAAARQALRWSPQGLLGAGLLLAALSGAVSLLAGRPPFTGHWVSLGLPAGGQWKLGTVLLFDTGVYLAVLGAVLLAVFTFAEE